LCVKRLAGLLSKSIEELPFQMAKSANKRVTGALFSEIVQSYSDGIIGVQDRYIPILQQFIRDPEIIRYAEEWMDYSLKILGFYDEEYWSRIKVKMRELHEQTGFAEDPKL
jgi:hypothetical protein